ncbi:MAG TPA: extracellular solute-binding protein [Thermomicrobiales bacterium]|nr:extracellular solute-binding protein [Thermomicrobiales bacterium]
MIALRGISWDHPRGHDPMVATAAAYMARHPDIRIEWATRSLKDFGDYPVDRLAEAYDLILVDHPFIGTAAKLGCLLPVDAHLDAAFLADQAANSVGPSHGSYVYDGHQWALAIDAAGQVSAIRPDLLAATDATAPRTWSDVLALAERTRASGRPRVAIPLVPTDAVMCLFTLCASAGEPPFAQDGRVVGRATGRHALEMLRRLAAMAHPESLTWNPIRALDRMSVTDEIAYIPLLFGYSNYARPGFRPNLVHFTDIPRAADGLPRGGVLGGVGLAVSAATKQADAAFDYARFVAEPLTQRTTFFTAGGQPGHRQAWLDPQVYAAASDFFRGTLATLDLAYLRPRFPGYPRFQEQAGETVHAFLAEHGDRDATLDRLDALLHATRTSAP